MPCPVCSGDQCVYRAVAEHNLTRRDEAAWFIESGGVNGESEEVGERVEWEV
jgi:hypothetical protein